MDKDFEEFLEWYQGNKKYFHKFQYDQKKVAYAAYLKGKRSALDMLDESLPRLPISSHIIKVKWTNNA